MEMLRFVDLIKFGFVTVLLASTVPDIGDSMAIFDIKLGAQSDVCSSLITPKNQSIADPSIIHPPAIRERINYEYTITSPNFPQLYPTNIHCITLIKAPSFDYHIVLEVRILFDIEPSKNCAQDFLEITDGPYGFSKRIGRFCNSDRPPKQVVSTGPFLWLRFRSDKSLPHNGFTIAYRFLRQTSMAPKTSYCYKQTIIPPGYSFNLNTSFLQSVLRKLDNFEVNPTVPFECVFDFHVNPGFLTFVYKAFFKKTKTPILCSSNSLDIYEKGTFEDKIDNAEKRNYFRICEENDLFKQHLQRHSTRTTVRVLAKELNKMNEMSFIFTSVKVTKENCSGDDFLCNKLPKLCISKRLTCDGEINCPDLTDEICQGKRVRQLGEDPNITTTLDPLFLKKVKTKMEEDKVIKNTNKTHAIILGTISSILVLSMVFCLVLTIHSRKKDKETRCINAVDIPDSRHDRNLNKNLFYELLQSSEPSVAALSTEKLNRKIYNENQIWSKRPPNYPSSLTAHRNNDSSYKLNGGLKSDLTIKSTASSQHKFKVENNKGHTLNRIGKYLSVPYPAKNDVNIKPAIPAHIQPYKVASPSDDFQSWSSHSFSKQNSTINRSTHQIQRASSMGSGLRRKLQEPVDSVEFSNNVEWYCGPVVRGSDNINNSSETLNANSRKPPHVPGCRSLPNFNHVGSQNPVYYTKPIPSIARHTDSLDCSADDNSSLRDDTPSFSFQNHSHSTNSHKFAELRRQNGVPTSPYGFQYFCAHDPVSSTDFVEYIA